MEKFRRRRIVRSRKKDELFELHVDASEKAYSAAVYLKSKKRENYFLEPIFRENRFCFVKGMTIL